MNKKHFWFWIVWLLGLVVFTGWRAHEDGYRDGRTEVLKMWADEIRAANVVEWNDGIRPVWVEFWGVSITGRCGWLGGPRMLIDKSGTGFAGEW